MTVPLFPGGVAASRLRVYDWPGADGLTGGSPHLHTASSEGYIVLSGSGEVHTLSSEGFAVTPLADGAMVWFSPGTVHRLVNHDRLELLVIMQNAGLPEAGDAVLTFPTGILDDDAAYRAAAALPDTADDAALASAALARRDLALAGYAELLAAAESEGPTAALAALHIRAARLVRPRVAEWTARWDASVARETERTRGQLAALAATDAGILSDARTARAETEPGERFGMCGRLRVWPRAETPSAP
ncbi:cupin domain-containing protein [Microbacterium chocolatum]|uniref:cupin domain-containing protein n=1 Tax=Microbacterium aurantiacum TaxID=162393 RepID=UPI00338D7461